MSHSCCCLDMDGGGGVQIADRDVVARKNYRCGECNAEISFGQLHNVYVGTSEGKIFTWRSCVPCAGIRRDFFNCGFWFGCMRQDFFDFMGFDYLGEWGSVGDGRDE